MAPPRRYVIRLDVEVRDGSESAAGRGVLLAHLGRESQVLCSTCDSLTLALIELQRRADGMIACRASMHKADVSAWLRMLPAIDAAASWVRNKSMTGAQDMRRLQI